jgi:hypothetical protein
VCVCVCVCVRECVHLCEHVCVLWQELPDGQRVCSRQTPEPAHQTLTVGRRGLKRGRRGGVTFEFDFIFILVFVFVFIIAPVCV